MNDRIGDVTEKRRLDTLRLECLKLAFENIGCGEGSAQEQAAKLFDFVTDAPERPTLFAVKRMDDAEPGNYPSLGPLNYLGFYGGVMRWDHEGDAYRFRSKAEAEVAIAKYETQLGGVMLALPLPSYMDLF